MFSAIDSAKSCVSEKLFRKCVTAKYFISITNDTAHIVAVQPCKRSEHGNKWLYIAIEAKSGQMQKRQQTGIDKYYRNIFLC